MSFQNTYNGQRLNKLLNNENWMKLGKLFKFFCFRRKYDWINKKSEHLTTFGKMADTVYTSFAMMNKKYDNEYLLKWFINFMQKQNYFVTELDIQYIKGKLNND